MGKLVAECDRDGEQTLGTLEHGVLRQLKPSLISAPALFSLVSSLREKEKREMESTSTCCVKNMTDKEA